MSEQPKAKGGPAAPDVRVVLGEPGGCDLYIPRPNNPERAASIRAVAAQWYGGQVKPQ